MPNDAGEWVSRRSPVPEIDLRCADPFAARHGTRQKLGLGKDPENARHELQVTSHSDSLLLRSPRAPGRVGRG